jgi:hypothetical protein
LNFIAISSLLAGRTRGFGIDRALDGRRMPPSCRFVEPSID